MLLTWISILTLALSSGTAATQDEGDAPAITVLDEHPQRRYILHAPPSAQEGKRAPKGGWKLLVVIPGGDGSAAFGPFVGRIREHALDDTWLVAQLIAPVWAAGQAETLVWPTKLHPWPKMEFDCEELFHAVFEDVQSKYELDERYVFTLAWSSGGPLAYTLALQKKTPVTGTFVAMSVYKPGNLPSLRHVRKRPFYLLHSPEDFIPIAMAQQAQKELEKKKAFVELQEYSGGHGWRGDVYGMIRKGIGWLEKKAPKR